MTYDYFADLQVAHAQEHIWLATSRGARCDGECSVPDCTVFLHPSRVAEAYCRGREDQQPPTDADRRRGGARGEPDRPCVIPQPRS